MAMPQPRAISVALLKKKTKAGINGLNLTFKNYTRSDQKSKSNKPSSCVLVHSKRRVDTSAVDTLALQADITLVHFLCHTFLL